LARTKNVASKVKSAKPRQSFARLAISVLMLVAFALQSYVTQTHIHLAPGSFASYNQLGAAKKQLPDKFPAQDDPANCPICQEILHSGQFVTPSAAAVLLPSLSVSIIAIVTHIVVAPEATSHTWQSRGPPQN
jgi:hypothetical protein